MAGRTPARRADAPGTGAPEGEAPQAPEDSRGGRAGGPFADRSPARVATARGRAARRARLRRPPRQDPRRARRRAALDARRPLRDPGHRSGEARGLRQGSPRPDGRRRAPRWPTRDRVVYSSATGRVCPVCGWPADDCRCSKNLAAPEEAVPEKPTAKLRLENRASGKHVTVVDGLPRQPGVPRRARPRAQEGLRDRRRGGRRLDRAPG